MVSLSYSGYFHIGSQMNFRGWSLLNDNLQDIILAGKMVNNIGCLIPCLEGLVDVHRRTFGETHPGEACLLIVLSQIYCLKDDYKLGLELAEKAVVFVETPHLLREKSSAKISVYSNLAEILRVGEDASLESAIEASDRALKLAYENSPGARADEILNEIGMGSGLRFADAGTDPIILNLVKTLQSTCVNAGVTMANISAPDPICTYEEICYLLLTSICLNSAGGKLDRLATALSEITCYMEKVRFESAAIMDDICGYDINRALAAFGPTLPGDSYESPECFLAFSKLQFRICLTLLIVTGVGGDEYASMLEQSAQKLDS